MRAPVATGFLVLALAGCVPPGEGAGPGSQNMIMVREFKVNASTRVVIDTSFGFSLQRGTPGVPLRQRAASVSRAVAFEVADALTERLRQLGYDAVHADAATPEPTGKSLIIVGTFRRIDEGHRRMVGNERASVAADIEIDLWAPGMQPLAALHVDSAQLGADGGAGAGASAVNSAARRVGRELARSVVEAARRTNLPGAAR